MTPSPAEIRVIVPPVLGDYAADLLGGLERVRLVTEDEARTEPADRRGPPALAAVVVR